MLASLAALCVLLVVVLAFFAGRRAVRQGESRTPGWTDDLAIPLAPERTVDDLVERVIGAIARGVEHASVVREVSETFALSEEDAELAVDRVHGGVTRAETRSRENRPDPAKDPIAFASFERAWRDEAIVASFARYREAAG